MNFETVVLTESYIKVPPQLLADVKEWYVEEQKKYLANPRAYRPAHRLFSADFTGTKYEFLNAMFPSVRVTTNTAGKNYFIEYHDNINTIKLRGLGHITLNVKTAGVGASVSTIEHELIHFVQFLLRARYIAKGLKGIDAGRMKHSKGDFEGNVNFRRTVHSLRPVEMIPNFITLLRSLQYKYERRALDEDKKTFFKRFLAEPSIIPHYSHIVTRLKRKEPQIYRRYLQLLYRYFVEEETFKDGDALKRLQTELYEIINNRQKKT
jgi:hypothetical protein